MISVLVITYNQEKYISKTLDSILAQEYSGEYEVVIGEDCSTDGTRQIIEQYQKKYPHIIKPIFNNSNQGLIKNYFNTLAQCSGELIMECAGDDWWLFGKAKVQIDFMNANPDVGMCYGYAKKWNEWESCFAKKKFGSKKTTFEDFIKGNDVPAPTVCYRKNLMDRYLEEVKPLEKSWLMEDYPQWLWFSANSKIYFMEKDLAVYRVLTESASHSTTYEKFMAFRRSTFEIQNYFLKKYCGLSLNSFDENLHSFYFYVLNSNHTEALKSIKKVKAKTKKQKILGILSKNIFTFKLLSLHYRHSLV